MSTTPQFCPLLTTTTDKRGLFEQEVRVSHYSWTSLTAQFNITVEKTSIIVGLEVIHVFDPPYLIMNLKHRESAEISFRDTTTSTVSGIVAFHPKLVDGHSCPFEGVPVQMTDSNDVTYNTVTDEAGMYNFSITRGDKATIYIPPFRGHTWETVVVYESSLIPQVDASAVSTRRLLETPDGEVSSTGMDDDIIYLSFIIPFRCRKEVANYDSCADTNPNQPTQPRTYMLSYDCSISVTKHFTDCCPDSNPKRLTKCCPFVDSNLQTQSSANR
jgi:hypothetical protein